MEGPFKVVKQRLTQARKDRTFVFCRSAVSVKTQVQPESEETFIGTAVFISHFRKPTRLSHSSFQDKGVGKGWVALRSCRWRKEMKHNGTF